MIYPYKHIRVGNQIVKGGHKIVSAEYWENNLQQLEDIDLSKKVTMILRAKTPFKAICFS